MGLLSKFSGKDVQDKIEDYSEIYGEILLGLHKELERQNAGLEKQEQHFNAQVKNLHDQTNDLASSLKKLEDHTEQNHLQITKELEKQGALLEKQEQHFNSQVENLHGQVKDLGSSLKKLEDRSEQNHLQITDELAKQGALIKKQEQHFNSQVENLHGQVKDLGGSLKKLEDRSEQNHLQITDEFKSFRTVIEQYRLEASTIEDMKKNLSQVIRKSDQQNKHIQILRIVCVLSYVFAIGVGVIIWMIS